VSVIAVDAITVCATMKHMTTVGIRALKQNASEVVRQASAGDVITISGTPTVSGPFNYSIPLTGGCGTVNATGTITVTPDMTVGAASSTPTLCINTV
jgi:hypothetical protein